MSKGDVGPEDGVAGESFPLEVDVVGDAGGSKARSRLRWPGEEGGVLEPASEGGLGRCLTNRVAAGPELSDGVGGSPLLQAMLQ